MYIDIIKFLKLFHFKNALHSCNLQFFSLKFTLENTFDVKRHECKAAA